MKGHISEDNLNGLVCEALATVWALSHHCYGLSDKVAPERIADLRGRVSEFLESEKRAAKRRFPWLKADRTDLQAKCEEVFNEFID